MSLTGGSLTVRTSRTVNGGVTVFQNIKPGLKLTDFKLDLILDSELNLNNLLISRSSSKKKSKDKSESEKEKPKLEKIQVRVQGNSGSRGYERGSPENPGCPILRVTFREL